MATPSSIDSSLSARHQPDPSQAVARVDESPRARSRRGQLSLPDHLDHSELHARTLLRQSRQHDYSRRVQQGVTINDWLIPVDLSYELDVWGRVRRSFESARAQAAATASDAGLVRLTVETDVAQFYYSLRSLDASSRS